MLTVLVVSGWVIANPGTAATLAGLGFLVGLRLTPKKDKPPA